MKSASDAATSGAGSPARLAIYSTMRGYAWGATEELWWRTASVALSRGHPVFVVVRAQILSHPKIRELRTAGAQVHRIPELVRGGHFNRLSARVRNFRTGTDRTLKALAAFGPDLLIVSQGGFYDFLLEDELRAVISKKRIHYTVLAHSNREAEIPEPALRTVAQDFIRGATTFFGVSQFVLNLAERQLLGRIENGALFQNPLDLPSGLPLPWPALAEPTFAVVSRLDAYGKGFDILFPALKAVPGLAADWRLNVYGDGPDRDYLVGLARWAGIADRVMFHGHVADKTVIWQANHLLLLPSRWEGSPSSVIEALLCGRPVLRTNYGGTEEWIRDGLNGFVCPAAEIGLLRATLATAWAARDRWPEMGRAAHAFAAKIVDPQPERRLLALLPA